jgi:hypothetical protein
MANRWKKEEALQKARVREGLSPAEIEILDAEEQFLEDAEMLHRDLFPEEYDHMLDSNVDAGERRSGNNPMRNSYQRKVNTRRGELGVGPLGENGMDADCGKSFEFVLERVRQGKRQDILNLISRYKLKTVEAPHFPTIYNELSDAEQSTILERLKSVYPEDPTEHRDLISLAKTMIDFFSQEDLFRTNWLVPIELMRRFPDISKGDAKVACDKANEELCKLHWRDGMK